MPSRSRTRVELLVNALEAGCLDMGVDLGGGDIGVAEHFLDGAEVGAVLEEVGCEGVTQGVRRYSARDSCP